MKSIMRRRAAPHPTCKVDFEPIRVRLLHTTTGSPFKGATRKQTAGCLQPKRGASCVLRPGQGWVEQSETLRERKNPANEATLLQIDTLQGILVHFLFFGEKKMNQKKRRKGREIISFPPLDPTLLKALKRHTHLYSRKNLRYCFDINVSPIEKHSFCSRVGGQKIAAA